MNKSVIISVKGTQTLTNQDTNVIELLTEGKYYKKGDNYYITYKESEVTGMKGTTTTIKVEKSVVALMRFGTVNSQLIFERGQKHICHYDTSHGVFTIGVLANEVDINIDDNGGEIRVVYELEVDNNRTGETDFHIIIREAGSEDDQHS